MSSITKTKTVRSTKIKIASLRHPTQDMGYAAVKASADPIQFEIDVYERGFPKEFSKYIVIDGVGENPGNCTERLTKYLVIANRVIEKSKDKVEKLEERVKELEKERDQLEIERDRSRGAGLAHADKLVQLEDAYGTDKFEQACIDVLVNGLW